MKLSALLKLFYENNFHRYESKQMLHERCAILYKVT